MKTLVVISFFMTMCLNIQAQTNTFTVRASGDWISDRLVNDSLRATGIRINDKAVLWDSVGVTFQTHYPDFDTIHYFDSEFVSRFHPGEKYMIVGSCCATLDISPEREAVLFIQEETKLGDAWDERKFDSLRFLYYDQPVAIKFSNKYKKHFKNQCAYSPDMAMFPYLVLLEKVVDTNWYYVPKGWYRTNFTTLVFLEVPDSLLLDLSKHDIDDREEIIESGYIEDVVFDAYCRYRFFHGEKLEIEYNPRKNKITKLSIIE